MALATPWNTAAQRSLFAFCAIADWLKQKAKHLLKSTVMSPDAIGFLVARQHKNSRVDFSVFTQEKIHGIFF